MIILKKVLEDLYSGLTLKKPVESEDYEHNSKLATKQIKDIIQQRIDEGENEISIEIGLKRGFDITNIHRLAAPLVEQWANEVFEEELDNKDYDLVGVEVASGRLDIVDVVLSFKPKDGIGFNAQVDVKATANDIKTSGKSPNITSYLKIRSAYVEDPNFMFVILSLKHSFYSDTKGDSIKQNLVVKEVNTYDLKGISSRDYTINPALGSGQLQIRDIHYVEESEYISTWDFCKILDYKFISSKRNDKDRWLAYAEKNGWLKQNI
jgi:hypothetical protein